MTYSFLANHLHESADKVKAYFASEYGAKAFLCEQEIDAPGDRLPLKPTWQASQEGYRLCLEVQESPISPTILEFVTKCATRNIPLKLWIAVPSEFSNPEFPKKLREAKEVGVGVISIPSDGSPLHILHHPVALSLFGLRKTDLAAVEKSRREIIKRAEDAYMDGRPEDGCRIICEELESITRRFAHITYTSGMWSNSHLAALKDPFFTTKPWATMLSALETHIKESAVKAKYVGFKKSLVVTIRGYTEWRNSLNHKPKTLKERTERDKKLKTNFEVTRDLLLEWFKVAKAFKIA